MVLFVTAGYPGDKEGTHSPKYTINPQHKIVAFGKEVKLECKTNGQPNPQIFWTKNGKTNYTRSYALNAKYNIS